MITSCPNCNTRFRVTPEQLASCNGLVRCGRCAGVFNGFASLQRREMATESGSSAQANSTQSEQISIDTLPGRVEGIPPQPTWTPAIGSKDAVGGQAPVYPAPAQAEAPATIFQALQGNITALPPSPIWTPSSDAVERVVQEVGKPPPAEKKVATALGKFEPTTAKDSVDEPLSNDALAEFAAALADTELDTKPGIPSNETNEETHATAPEPALVRPDLHKHPRPRRRKLVAVCLILVILLAGQAVYILRTEIAANWPETKPYLAGFCKQFGCKVPLPRQIDQITIESSEMQADVARPNVILVTAILRNRSTTVQAYPLLEVTLTDTFDRPIARRSLAAAEYSNGVAKQEDGLAPNSETITRTAIETIDMTPSGYRLNLYYR